MQTHEKHNYREAKLESEGGDLRIIRVFGDIAILVFPR
jgi:hypothetical protein